MDGLVGVASVGRSYQARDQFGCQPVFLNHEFLAHNTFSRRAIDELVAKRSAECQEEERIDDPTFALGHDGKRGWGLGTVARRSS